MSKHLLVSFQVFCFGVFRLYLLPIIQVDETQLFRGNACALLAIFCCRDV